MGQDLLFPVQSCKQEREYILPILISLDKGLIQNRENRQASLWFICTAAISACQFLGSLLARKNTHFSVPPKPTLLLMIKSE